MKYFFHYSIFLFIFISSFSYIKYRTPIYLKLSYKITAKTAQKLQKHKNLFLIGTGGQMMHDVQMMAMSFNYYNEVDLEQARELVIYAINAYLSEINNNEDIKPYLHEYPFTAKNIEIRIFLYNSDQSDLPPENIYCITSINGILKYYNYIDRDCPIYKEVLEKSTNIR